jgi:putative transposase
MLGQRRRDQTAAKPCFRKLLNGCRYGPRVLVTERLKRSGAAKRERLPGVEPRQPRYLNQRADTSPPSTRQRERRRQGFQSSGHAQRFLSAYGPLTPSCRPRRHLRPAATYRHEMPPRFHTWQDITNLPTAAYGARLRQSCVFLSGAPIDTQQVDNADRHHG